MSLKKKTKEFFSVVLRFGLSAALLAYLFSKIDLSAMKGALKSADFSYIYLAILIFFVIHFILLARWTIFIRALGLKVPFSRIVSSFFIGLFFNLFLPTSTGGDILRVWYLFKDTKQKAKAVASVVADRLCGYISIVMLATIAFIFGFRLLNDNFLLAMISILAFVAFLSTLILFHERSYTFCCRIFGRWHKLKESLMHFHYAIALLKDKPLALLSTVGLSMFSQSCLALVFYLIARALHQNISIIYFLIFVPMTCVVASLPSIGGLGFRGAGTAYLFGKVGMATGIAVSISLINFLFMVMIGLVGGVFYVIALSPGRIQHNKTDSGLEPEEA